MSDVISFKPSDITFLFKINDAFPTTTSRVHILGMSYVGIQAMKRSLSTYF